MNEHMINTTWLDQAKRLTPELHQQNVYPERMVSVVQDEDAFQGWSVEPVGSAAQVYDQILKKGDCITLDFGTHHVGYVTLSLQNMRSNADAPLRLRLTFGEMPCEVGEDFSEYKGWLSRSWLQDEIINVDVLPGTITLDRRYAFRYLKIEVLETSIR
ncbi:hypothetical protein YWY31_07150 [Paenibacillus illinoisensis]|uniref:hypothetical protein n=1 Tax=Paenibacillus illinoisensis TaxID=59845 RepID=UPI0034BFFBBC